MRIARVFLCLLIVLGQISLFMPMARAVDAGDVVISQMYPGTYGGDTSDQEFVELTNNSDLPVDVTKWCVSYIPYTGNKAGEEVLSCLLPPNENTKLWVAPHGRIVFVSNELNQAMATAADGYFSGGMYQVKGYVRLVDANKNEVDKLGWGSVSDDKYPAAAKPVSGRALLRKSIEATLQDTNIDNDDFVDTDPVIHASNIYEEETSAPDPPTDIVDCAGIVINEIGANLTNQFVELYNSTDASVQLAGCKLQTNRSSKTYELVPDKLEAGEYLRVRIADTDLTLTKTTTGIVYLLSSDGLTEDDAVSYSNLLNDTSWARFTDGWRQTYALTPGSENVDQPYLPCDDGYYRNMATGRCNKIPVEKPLAACAPDQYRNPETGRCKKVVVKTVTPCRDNQYRSEETGRCRNVLGASTTRTPCRENQYRSEETNRCRNLPASGVPDAAFAVQPVKDTGSTFIGWWALGGVSLLAVGYGVWEWRQEVISILHRLIRRS